MTSTAIKYQMADGVVLRGDAYGASDRPPILLLHGGGQTRHAWGGAAKALAHAGFYAVAIDQRGQAIVIGHRAMTTR